VPREASALDPRKAVRQYVAQSWEADQGLPQNSIFAALQTSDAYLWLGTQEGLIRFDGVRFTVFDRHTVPVMRQHDIRALYEDTDHGLWIATGRGGVLRYKNGSFTAYGGKEGLANDHVTSVVGDPRGDIWFGTSAGVSRFAGGAFTTVSAKDGLPHDEVGSLYVSTDGISTPTCLL
jgi:ligand-binding sensor domain-containing protein